MSSVRSENPSHFVNLFVLQAWLLFVDTEIKSRRNFEPHNWIVSTDDLLVFAGILHAQGLSDAKTSDSHF